jgi:transposase
MALFKVKQDVGSRKSEACTGTGKSSYLVRVLLSSRKAVLTKCVDLENEIRGLERLLGIRLPSPLKHGAFDTHVRDAIEAHTAIAQSLFPLLDARLVLFKTYLKRDKQANALTREDSVCRRLMTVPGVGTITALTFKASVDDPKRFKRSRTVAAHFGLTPRRYQSGEIDNPCRVSKAGVPDVRSALYVAAHALVTRSARWSSLNVWGLRLEL